MPMPRPGRRVRYLLPVVLLSIVSWFAWTELTRSRGDQKASFPPASQVCDSEGPLRYCINTAAAGTNGDVVYHHHGRKLDETLWNDDTYFTGMLQARWHAAGVLPPTVVTVSYGPTWLLTPKGKQEDSGLLEDFMSRLPALEAKVGRPRRRMLLGESMGGLNVLVAGLSHPTRFAKVAALCPGVYLDSPFSSLGTLRASMERTGANPKIVFGVWLLARRYVADEAEWRRVSPLELISQAGPGTPELYLSCGLYDAYGNYEGTERLAQLARQRGVKTEWHPLYGGHCASDVSSLADFLVN
ncbi:alpha/beta hydrolase-fold protein [Myxococcus faecalis]|uniref:alpha/beta hydrolase-fold protein n=1 Tax=Myxococcus TaxID=32 RepID=UPI001CBCB973|nr:MULTISPECIES: alpha/beta hydrolase-fold protein [unclassified Myxococcus]MBZ4401459.1 esterase family protein [Myxococcus sp. AS-1-15]BDT32430.1 alpha/beta hydrolase-fold protein [Myxococcus sp. MH1]